MKTAGRYSGKIRFLAAAGILLAVLAGAAEKKILTSGKQRRKRLRLTGQGKRSFRFVGHIRSRKKMPDGIEQDTMKEMIGRLGEAGYAAVDSEIRPVAGSWM